VYLHSARFHRMEGAMDSRLGQHQGGYRVIKEYGTCGHVISHYSDSSRPIDMEIYLPRRCNQCKRSYANMRRKEHGGRATAGLIGYYPSRKLSAIRDHYQCSIHY
jgi:hypothetical protein